ncbi:unnamed protein product [Prorocentrum cordatum]|uniref:Uncharacterized protein n=1 Tax=Prorocentrum cordatum TaxID=2364126 RepID=A0ABN9VPD3_9DINO|nr:unnamed protein product [Polarella glacialis]
MAGGTALALGSTAPGRQLGHCASAEGGAAAAAWDLPRGRPPRAGEGAWPSEASGGGEASCTTASGGQGCDSAEGGDSQDGLGDSSEDAQDSDDDRQAGGAAFLPSADLLGRLRCYGYFAFAQDAGAWHEQPAVPVARIRVNARIHVDGHTHYVIESQLARLGEGKAPLAWSTRMRLKQLRQETCTCP